MKTFKTPKGTELPFLNLRGKDYLQVMHRLVWFREEHPNWSIITGPVDINEKYSIFKAEIRNDDAQIIQTGYGREDSKDFADHLEKSETKAIGRALAACGYGTQFAPELDEQHRIVDSPRVSFKVENTDHPISNKGPIIEPYRSAHHDYPKCCGEKMNVSKFNDNELYCFKCKKKVPRVTALPEQQDGDLPF